MGWVKDLVIGMAQRTPWERTLFPPPDRMKDLEKVSQVLNSAPGRSPSPAPVAVQPRPAGAVAVKEQVSPEAMLDYQKRLIYGQLWLLQGHLTNGCRIDGEVCDCCSKHVLALEALTAETQPMDPADPLWPEIAGFCNVILYKTEVAAVISGTYAAEYPGMSAQVRGLRKRVEVGSSPATVNEAKAEVAELAKDGGDL